MTDRPPSPARRAALLRLLEDWEAERMTEWRDLDPGAAAELLHEGRMAHGLFGLRCLTPAGLSAARAIREGKDGI